MRTWTAATAALLALVAVAACGEEAAIAEKPSPHEVSDAAIGRYCGMGLAEHAGPKAQIFLTDRKEPLWFSSVRDAFAFTMLPEEPKNVAAIYVNDMSRAQNWDQPEPGTWIDAKQAYYVLGSSREAGMGGGEAVPFGNEADAQRFTAAHGGRIVAFADVPRDYVLSGEGAPPQPAAPASGTSHKGEGSHAQGH
jgi:copper chaperone NosL